jgi:hypothetical protein
MQEGKGEVSRSEGKAVWASYTRERGGVWGGEALSRSYTYFIF